jgi:hypothetical protein
MQWSCYIDTVVLHTLGCPQKPHIAWFCRRCDRPSCTAAVMVTLVCVFPSCFVVCNSQWYRAQLRQRDFGVHQWISASVSWRGGNSKKWFGRRVGWTDVGQRRRRIGSGSRSTHAHASLSELSISMSNTKTKSPESLACHRLVRYYWYVTRCQSSDTQKNDRVRMSA